MPDTLAERVRMLRRKAHVRGPHQMGPRQGPWIGQQELSLLLGYSKTVVNQIERGKLLRPRAGLVAQLADALGTTPNFLLNGSGEEPSHQHVTAAIRAFIAKKATEGSTEI